MMMRIGNLDDGGTGTSLKTISQLKCFRYLWSLQIVMATINGDYKGAESYLILN